VVESPAGQIGLILPGDPPPPTPLSLRRSRLSLNSLPLRLIGPICAGLALLGCTSVEPDSAPAPPPVAMRAAEPVLRAKLQQVSGTVMLKRAAGDDWAPASSGLGLFENDKVRTAGGASAALHFANGSVVSVGEDALVSIAETRPRPGQERTDLTVLKGQVDAEVDDGAKQSLTVSTPAATVRAGREIVFQ
jgi:ferric-dicitrate binding protein FerR (iron transport regulator)